MSASLAVQRLVHGALAALPGFAGVYDGPPADAAPPYLVIGPDSVGEWGTKTEIGHEHRVAVSLWTDAPGMAAAKALLGPVEAALLALAGARDGHRVVTCRLQRCAVIAQPGGWTQGLVEVRVRTVMD
jgi:hypothetical protein